MENKDARSLSPEAKETLRMRAVKAVLDGYPQVEVARLFNISRQALYNWLQSHSSNGFSALRKRPQGRRPGGGALKGWQAAQIVRTLKTRNPDQLTLPFYLWTREAVQQLIFRRFGLQLSLSTVGRYLKRWGFTPQKPVRRAYEKNDQAVQCWLDEEYPAIHRQAKREKARIYWGDEMGMRSDHSAGRSYGERGRTPAINGTGQRFGCNMISAITNQGTLNFMIFKGRFSADVFLNYMKRLIKQADKKVFLIVDRHPVHRAGKVKQWVEQHKDKVSLFFLPSYSPELNPDEVLNQDVKSNALGTRRPRNRDEMIKGVRSYLYSRQKKPHIIKNYFKEQNIRYAA